MPDDDSVPEFAKAANLIAETEDAIHRDAAAEDRATERPARNADDGEASEDSVSDSEEDISVQRVSSDCLGNKSSKEKCRFMTALLTSQSLYAVL